MRLPSGPWLFFPATRTMRRGDFFSVAGAATSAAEMVEAKLKRAAAIRKCRTVVRWFMDGKRTTDAGERPPGTARLQPGLSSCEEPRWSVAVPGEYLHDRRRP